MLIVFYLCSQKRKYWLLLSISVCILELISLYFQYNMGIKPCVLCIYERVALFVILASALIPVISSKSFFRYAGIILWLYSSWKGLKISWKHIRLKFYPSPFDFCEISVNFPPWLPLNKWLPFLFESYSDCIQKQWMFSNIEISIWLFIIFIGYFLLAITTLLSQFLQLKTVIKKN